VPWGVRFWKSILRPLGIAAVFGAVIAAFAHYTNFGPKKVRGSADADANIPSGEEVKR
jgi:hypothetical protein